MDKDLDAKKALECLVALSQISYEHVRKGKQFNSSPEDVVQLTERLCSLYCSEPPKNILRYLTCLYHIIHCLFTKDSLDHMATLFQTIVKFKQANLKSYQDDAKSLHNPFCFILRESVMKVVSREDNTLDKSFLSVLFSLLLEVNSENKTLSSGKILLESVLQAAQVVSKRNDKQTVRLITTGLNIFYKSDNVKDVSLTMLFQIYTFLFYSQNKISGCHSALAALKSQLDYAKWKFSENVRQGECFLLVCNSVNLFMWNCTENTMIKKIQDNINVLKAFKNSEEDEKILATCGFVAFLLIHSHSNEKQSIPVLPEICLKPFFIMVLNLYMIIKNSPNHKSDFLRAISFNFFLLAEANQAYSKKVLKSCVTEILKTRDCIQNTLKELISTNPSKAVKDTALILPRCANLIRTFYVEEMWEEVVTISKPFCNFLVMLPSDVFESPQNLKSFELCFTCLVSGLGAQRLGKVFECLVVWLFKCPQSSPRVFKTWGDFKHNLVCEGRKDELETNVWTVVNERRSNLDSEWPPINISPKEVGNFLLQELKTYSENRILRGKPAISTADALLDLDVDCLIHAKGLVIAMDVATSNPDFGEYCTVYNNMIKSLISSLRKQRKKYNPIEFNCCIGDLLYAQIRCQLKYLRTECECEMVKLTVSPSKPLVAELPESKPDPNDTCDVATRYQHLCLAQQRKLMDAIDSAIRHWGFACGMLKETSQAELDLKVTLTNLQDAGSLMKLYCDEVKEEKIWSILYDMAVVVGDTNLTVQAAGELMSISTNVDQEVMEKVTMDILNNPNLSEKNKLSYILKSALFSLKTNRIQVGLAFLQKFEEAEKKNSVQMSEYYFIVGQFQQLSDWKKYNHTFNNCPTFHFSLHHSLKRLLYLVNEMSWTSFGELCQQQHNLMSVSCLLGEANWTLDQPREARAYLKIALPIAQKLALPLRTVQLLLLLGWVDLNTGEAEACAYKLEGIEDLLELCGTPVVYGRSVDSPSLGKTMLRPPDYLSHPPTCQCLPCTTIEYRRLVLESLTLRAAFCAAFGRPSDAVQSFQVAKMVEKELCKSNVRTVSKSCAAMWLRYAEFKAASQEYQEAITANNKAAQLLSFVRDPIALQRTFEQKIVIQYSLHQLQVTPIKPKLVIDTKKTTPSKVQTPKSLKSKVTESSPLATINNNIKPVTPFLRPVRPLRIPSSGEENTPVAVTKQKRITKLPPKFSNETPQSNCKFLSSSKKQFVVVDDSGMAVGVSGSKTATHSSRKLTDVKGKLQEPKNISKKKLFPCGSSVSISSQSNSSNAIDEPLITRQARNPVVKTYRNLKLASRKADLQQNNKSEISKETIDESKLNWSGEVFSFDQIKNSLNEIDNCKSKPIDEKESNSFSSSLPIKKQNTLSFSDQLSSMKGDSSKSRELKSSRKVSIDSNCDYIEGTPPESPGRSVTLIPKRITRSRKL